MLRVALSELLQTSEPDKDSFYKLFKQFITLQDKTKKELIEKAGKNSEFADSLSQIDIAKFNSIAELTSVLKVFLERPELLNKMQGLLYMKESKKE